MAAAAERETLGGPTRAGGGGAWRGPVATLLWAVVGFSACWSLTDLEPNLVEEGLLLHVAQRLVHGEHLYRDIVYFTGPLPFELLALLFRIFGEEIAVGRTVMALFLGGATAATWSFARRSGAGALAFPAAAVVASTPALLFPMFSMFYYTPLAFCFGVLAVDAASRGAESARWAFAAGVLVAAMALCKQTLGVVFAATLLPAVAIALPRTERFRRIAAMTAGGACLAMLTVAFYAVKGDLDDLWRCLVTIPLGLSESFSSPYMNLWPPGELAAEILPNRLVYFSSLYFLRFGLFSPQRPGYVLLFQFLYALPLLALLATGIAAALRRLPVGGWLNTAFLVAMTSNLFPRSDWGHLILALPPALIQLILLSARLPGFGNGRKLVATGLACALTVTLAASAYRIDRWVHFHAGKPTWGPRVPLRPVSAVYRVAHVPRAIRFLRRHLEPGEPIFVARAEPLLYFATDTTNPTPYTGVLTVMNEEQQDRILEALPSVRFVVMSDIDQPLWTYYSEELPRIQRHLERHYRDARGYPQDDASWLVILERGEDRGPTLIDLLDLQREGGAKAWVREERTGPEIFRDRKFPKMVARQNRRPLPVHLGRWGGGVDFEVDVPANARFEASVGFRGMVSLGDFHEHPKRSLMVVSIGRDGAFEEVVRVAVDDAPRAGNRWTPIEADLSRWAGQRVTLRLGLETRVPVGRRDLTWWGSPRIAEGPADSAEGSS